MSFLTAPSDRCAWLVVLVALVFQTPIHGKEKRAPAEPPTVDARLPNVLLIGDSITLGYAGDTRALLAGRANVFRIPHNAEESGNLLSHLDDWLGDRKWAVIHFNVGLHDIEMDWLSHKAPLDKYRGNLTKIVAKLKPTGAKLVWASTTPVPAGARGRRAGDEVTYNSAAAEIMAADRIPVDDLYSAVKPELSRLQKAQNVHFTPEGYRFLGAQAAARIGELLAQSRRSSAEPPGVPLWRVAVLPAG